MAIVQDTFFIPDDLATGLSTGLYRRIGGVVRYASGPNKGQIVKHLEPINLKAAEQTQKVSASALSFFKQHKKGTLIGLGAAAVFGVGCIIYSNVKDHEPKVVREFRKALSSYIAAIRNGDMDVSKIDALMVSLRNLRANKDYDKIRIQLTAEEIDLIINRIYTYTVELAKNNHVELSSENLSGLHASCSDNILNLQTYLMAQKKVFQEAA